MRVRASITLSKELLEAVDRCAKRQKETRSAFIEVALRTFITKKTSDLAKPEFDKHSGNWLSVYDSLPVPFARDTPKRWADLSDKLGDYFAGVFQYDTVFIDSANEPAEFTPAGHVVRTIVNLWRRDGSSLSRP